MSESFIGGLVSGTSQVIIGHPLDTIKLIYKIIHFVNLI